MKLVVLNKEQTVNRQRNFDDKYFLSKEEFSSFDGEFIVTFAFKNILNTFNNLLMSSTCDILVLGDIFYYPLNKSFYIVTVDKYEDAIKSVGLEIFSLNNLNNRESTNTLVSSVYKSMNEIKTKDFTFSLNKLKAIGNILTDENMQEYLYDFSLEYMDSHINKNLLLKNILSMIDDIKEKNDLKIFFHYENNNKESKDVISNYLSFVNSFNYLNEELVELLYQDYTYKLCTVIESNKNKKEICLGINESIFEYQDNLNRIDEIKMFFNEETLTSDIIGFQNEIITNKSNHKLITVFDKYNEYIKYDNMYEEKNNKHELKYLFFK